MNGNGATDYKNELNTHLMLKQGQVSYPPNRGKCDSLRNSTATELQAAQGGQPEDEGLELLQQLLLVPQWSASALLPLLLQQLGFLGDREAPASGSTRPEDTAVPRAGRPSRAGA